MNVFNVFNRFNVAASTSRPIGGRCIAAYCLLATRQFQFGLRLNW
jgi:hypothetical protein